MQVGETRQRGKSPEKRGENTAKRKRATDAAPRICEDRLNAKQADIESQSSRQFRISQLEMEEAVKAKDSNNELRQSGRVKEMPRLDRILRDQAFEERE